MTIQWHQDGMSFDTLRESHEWAYQVIYNEIGNLYNGYITSDEKIAYTLVFELVRSNTPIPRFEVHTQIEFDTPESAVYRIWVTPTNECI
ncbi:hypothetical protein EV586_10464 [Tumebacillus sp. BK434]|uniref:hypothetical protein n=1 Tax=Tumebacillus sp. BK434 TaxID=2512169 RepID=UPI00104554E2|nr:hypothetical protein [Tumebacillus sp. BK434]TCP54446.1 hypothetical protein EV586_10464 [Tumebacillus sp. BK434]